MTDLLRTLVAPVEGDRVAIFPAESARLLMDLAGLDRLDFQGVETASVFAVHIRRAPAPARRKP